MQNEGKYTAARQCAFMFILCVDLRWDEPTPFVPITSLKRKFIVLFLYDYGCFTCMYVCVLHVDSTHKGQKRASDPLGLELQMLVSYRVLLGLRPRSSAKPASALNH